MWRHLGAPGEPHIISVHEEDRIIGIAPLALDGLTARFLGSHEVCDYQDLITAPGKAPRVLESVLAHLSAQGIHQLDLRTLRPDAEALDALKTLVRQQRDALIVPDDVTFESELPDSWERYLQQLNGKQRHEVRRKLRRLETHGPFTYRLIENNGHLDRAVDAFVDLFRRNRRDKAEFMSPTMSAYFRDLIKSLSAQHMLRLCFLDVVGQAAAAVLCIDYNGIRYLYNSGYDEHFEPLSVGILSKVLSIQNSIEMGCRRYDFLKGAEVYKKRIGGQELPLVRCKLSI